MLCRLCDLGHWGAAKRAAAVDDDRKQGRRSPEAQSKASVKSTEKEAVQGYKTQVNCNGYDAYGPSLDGNNFVGTAASHIRLQPQLLPPAT